MRDEAHGCGLLADSLAGKTLVVSKRSSRDFRKKGKSREIFFAKMVQAVPAM